MPRWLLSAILAVLIALISMGWIRALMIGSRSAAHVLLFLDLVLLAGLTVVHWDYTRLLLWLPVGAVLDWKRRRDESRTRVTPGQAARENSQATMKPQRRSKPPVAALGSAAGRAKAEPLEQHARAHETPSGIRHFFSKIAGVTKRNDDSSDRQKIIRRCRVREQLLLRREPENAYDPNAVAVCRLDGDQIGYLNADLAEAVSEQMRTGQRYFGFVSQLTGGTWSKPIRGVNILLVAAKQGTKDDAVRQYLAALDLGGRPPRLVMAKPGSGSGCLGTIIILILAVACAWLWIATH